MNTVETKYLVTDSMFTFLMSNDLLICLYKYRLVCTHSCCCLWCCGSSYLNSDLGEVHLHGELLTAVHVWVVGLLEGTLQLMQLIGGEGGAVAPVLLLGLIILARLWRIAFITLYALPQFVQFLITLVCV